MVCFFFHERMTNSLPGTPCTVIDILTESNGTRSDVVGTAVGIAPDTRKHFNTLSFSHYAVLCRWFLKLWVQ